MGERHTSFLPRVREQWEHPAAFGPHVCEAPVLPSGTGWRWHSPSAVRGTCVDPICIEQMCGKEMDDLDLVLCCWRTTPAMVTSYSFPWCLFEDSSNLLEHTDIRNSHQCDFSINNYQIWSKDSLYWWEAQKNGTKCKFQSLKVKISKGILPAILSVMSYKSTSGEEGDGSFKVTPISSAAEWNKMQVHCVLWMGVTLIWFLTFYP